MEAQHGATVATYLREHYQALLAFVRTMIDDAAARDGEDVVQDVALSVLSRAVARARHELVQDSFPVLAAGNSVTRGHRG